MWNMLTTLIFTVNITVYFVDILMVLPAILLSLGIEFTIKHPNIDYFGINVSSALQRNILNPEA